MKFAPADAIICDGLPMGLRAGFMHNDGSYWHFVPYRAAPPVVAADEITIEPDDVSMLDAIPGYGRLRGF